MGQSFPVFDSHSWLEETLHRLFFHHLTFLKFSTLLLQSDLSCMMSPVSDNCSLRILPRDGNIRNERQQKEKHWRILDLFNPLKFHLKWTRRGEKRKDGTCFLHYSLHQQNSLDRKHTRYLTKKTQWVKEWERRYRHFDEDRKCCKQSICHGRRQGWQGDDCVEQRRRGKAN